MTRALETVAGPDGPSGPAPAGPSSSSARDRPARVVDGLVTGWHAPGASHLRLLEAVAGPHLVAAPTPPPAEHGYRWHEFGDSALLLP